MWKKAFTWADGLTSPEKAVLGAYEEFAGAGPHVYVTTEYLCIVTSLSREAALKARRSVVAKGWLREVEAATKRHAAKYLLTVPADVTYHPRTPESIRETLPSGEEFVVVAVRDAEPAEAPERGERRPRTILGAASDYVEAECPRHEGYLGGMLANGSPRCPLCRRAGGAK